MADQVIDLGPMQVYFDGAPMPVVKGGVQFSFNFETINTVADVSGTFPRNVYFIGGSCSLTANYTELTMAQIRGLFPVVDGTSKMASIPVGASALDYEGTLLLRPVIEGVVSTDDDLAWYAPRVVPIPQFNLNFGNEQRVFPVQYQVIPYDAPNGDYSLIGIGVSSYSGT